MEVEESVNKISLVINLIKRQIRALLIISPVFIFIFFYALWDFIDNNQKFVFACNKTKNECVLETKRLFLSDEKQNFKFNNLGDAILHNVGCHYMICYYNIEIPYGDSYIKLYSSSENTKVQEWIIEHFNANKNNPEINSFELNTNDAPLFVSTLSFYTIIAFPLILLIILFFVNVKVTVIVDKEQELLIIENKRIIGVKKDKISLNRIKDIEIVNTGKCSIVNYRLKSGVDYEILRLDNFEEADRICQFIKTNIFSG